MRKILKVLRSPLVQTVGQLTLGAGLSQFILLAAIPIIMQLYGAKAFGIYATVFAMASVLGSAMSLRLDIVIPFIEMRHRSLHLVAAALGITCIVAISGLVVIAAISLLWDQPFAEATPFVWWVPVVALGQTAFVVCRVWMVRCSLFRWATISQILRAVIFVSCSVLLGSFVFQSGSNISLGHGILISQVCGDLFAVGFLLSRMPRRVRRLMVALPPKRAVREMRANQKFIGTSWLVGMLAIVNQNIPIWIVSYVFGMQAAGWFSAAQRIVAAPVQFAINTIGVAFSQRLRIKKFAGEPILREVTQLAGILILILSPVFAFLAWLASTGNLSVLGDDWTGASSTLSAMVLISFGSILYSAVEGVPLLLQLNRALVIYHSARFVMTALISVAALIGLLSYGAWIYAYAACEIVLYTSNGAFLYLHVQRTEAQGRNATLVSEG